MKEHSMSSNGRPAAAGSPEWTIGLDLGDRWSQYCVLDGRGEVVEERRVATTGKGLSGLGGGPELAGKLSVELQGVLGPVLAAVRGLTEQIRDCDRRIERVVRERYPELGRLTQAPGVGVLTALAYVLTMEDAGRCRKSREAGCVFGLRPKRRDSGQSRPQLGITKEGDPYVRQLLVECAQHILGPFGRDCHLRRWGLELAGRGGRGAKRKALAAVARKLAVLLHRLWVSGEKWEPWPQRQSVEAA